MRRGVIRQILQLLTHRDFFRPHQGEETRHYYYNACDILGDHDIDELFPEEDFVPPDLNFQENGESLPQGSHRRDHFCSMDD